MGILREFFLAIFETLGAWFKEEKDRDYKSELEALKKKVESDRKARELEDRIKEKERSKDGRSEASGDTDVFGAGDWNQ